MIDGEQHRCCVALIEETKPDGSPHRLRIIGDKETLDLEDPALPRMARDSKSGNPIPAFVAFFVRSRVVEREH